MDALFPLSLVIILVVFESVGGQLSQQQRDDFVNSHNAKRRTVTPTAANMRELVWNSGLESIAQAYANKCLWQHNENRGAEGRRYGFSSVGENLYLTYARGAFPRETAATASTISWDKERDDYTYSSSGGGTCNAGKECGHFTQLAWAKSASIGCGIADCSSVFGSTISEGTIVVCNYGPSGNFRGSSPWVSGTACSQCPTEAPNCMNGLCTNQASSSATAGSTTPSSSATAGSTTRSSSATAGSTTPSSPATAGSTTPSSSATAGSTTRSSSSTAGSTTRFSSATAGTTLPTVKVMITQTPSTAFTTESTLITIAPTNSRANTTDSSSGRITCFQPKLFLLLIILTFLMVNVSIVN